MTRPVVESKIAHESQLDESSSSSRANWDSAVNDQTTNSVLSVRKKTPYRLNWSFRNKTFVFQKKKSDGNDSNTDNSEHTMVKSSENSSHPNDHFVFEKISLKVTDADSDSKIAKIELATRKSVRLHKTTTQLSYFDHSLQKRFFQEPIPRHWLLRYQSTTSSDRRAALLNNIVSILRRITSHKFTFIYSQRLLDIYLESTTPRNVIANVLAEAIVRSVLLMIGTPKHLISSKFKQLKNETPNLFSNDDEKTVRNYLVSIQKKLSRCNLLKTLTPNPLSFLRKWRDKIDSVEEYQLAKYFAIRAMFFREIASQPPRVVAAAALFIAGVALNKNVEWSTHLPTLTTLSLQTVSRQSELVVRHCIQSTANTAPALRNWFAAKIDLEKTIQWKILEGLTRSNETSPKEKRSEEVK